MAFEEERAALGAYLAKHHLKHTKQRDTILEAFLSASGHVSSEELYHSIRDLNPRIGYTTVYRTMKLLVDAGLAQDRHFEDGVARYEVEHQHHDHLVCLGCGKIVEFHDPTIEESQLEVAAKHDFEILRHRHELYGRCRDCREG